MLTSFHSEEDSTAKTGEGVPALLEAIAAALPPDRRKVTLLLPFSQGALAEQCRREGAVEREEYVEEGLSMTVTLGLKLLAAVKDYEVPEGTTASGADH